VSAVPEGTCRVFLHLPSAEALGYNAPAFGLSVAFTTPKALGYNAPAFGLMSRSLLQSTIITSACHQASIALKVSVRPACPVAQRRRIV